MWGGSSSDEGAKVCEGWKVVHAPTKDQDLWREQVATGGKSTLEGWIVDFIWFHSVSAFSSGGKLQLAFFGWGTDPVIRVIRFDGAASHSSDSVGCPIDEAFDTAMADVFLLESLWHYGFGLKQVKASKKVTSVRWGPPEATVARSSPEALRMKPVHNSLGCTVWHPNCSRTSALWIGAWLAWLRFKGLNDFQEDPAWDGFSNRFSILFLNHNPFPARVTLIARLS